jgi:hypothetical protein
VGMATLALERFLQHVGLPAGKGLPTPES